MMSSKINELLERIDDTPTRGVLVCMGGGSNGHCLLMNRPGSTATILETRFLQASVAFDEWLGYKPRSYCCPETTRKAARAAYWRALDLNAPATEGTFGMAVNCTLKTHRPHKGPHRFHIAVQTADETFCTTVMLEKDVRNRRMEEAAVGREMIRALAHIADVGFHHDVLIELLTSDERGGIVTEQAKAPPNWQDLMSGCQKFVCDDGFAIEPGVKFALLPAALNPLHEGHCKMLAVGAEITGLPACFEVSISNADNKPPIDFLDMQRITEAVRAVGLHVIFSSAATFVEKAGLYRNCTFLVGWDTLVRISNVRFYRELFDLPGDPPPLRAALRELSSNGAKFLVFGRVDEDGVFNNLSNPGDVDIPAELRELCEEVPEAMFRNDTSSTAVREREAADDG
jgi:hypothetical protein